MKRIILLTFLLVAFLSQINAQNNITLNINHKLGDADFEMNQAAKNNMDHDFKVTRLEYYISKISLIHDGGQETEVKDLWVLANASNTTQVELGTFDITSMEKIKFYIGVDPEFNHLDPSIYDSDHPLAPKAPSMHWGWAPGYRFVAVEGKSGTGLNQIFQVHGLGDKNFFSNEIDFAVVAENNQIDINLDADYTRALENIRLTSGLFSHSENDEAQECVENFRDFVFSPSSISNSTIDFSEVLTFNTFPNPVVNGITSIELKLDNNTSNYDITISTIDGKQLQSVQSISDGQQINVSSYASGLYLINLIKNGHPIITNKMYIK